MLWVVFSLLYIFSVFSKFSIKKKYILKHFKIYICFIYFIHIFVYVMYRFGKMQKKIINEGMKNHA